MIATLALVLLTLTWLVALGLQAEGRRPGTSTSRQLPRLAKAGLVDLDRRQRHSRR